MNNITYALMILVLWLMLLHYPFLLGSVQTQNKLVPALRQPAYTYKKGTKRQRIRKQWNHTGRNNTPKLLHVCILGLEKPGNVPDKSFKEGLKGENSFCRAFSNSEGKRGPAPNSNSLRRKSWCHRLYGNSKKCFDLRISILGLIW